MEILVLGQVGRKTPVYIDQGIVGSYLFCESGRSSLIGSKEITAKGWCWMLLGCGDSKKVIQQAVTGETGEAVGGLKRENPAE